MKNTLRDLPNVDLIKWGCWDEPKSAGNKGCVLPEVGRSKREGTSKGRHVALPPLVGPGKVKGSRGCGVHPAP